MSVAAGFGQKPWIFGGLGLIIRKAASERLIFDAPYNNCPYVHPVSCRDPEVAKFFALWARAPPKGSSELLDAASDVLHSINAKLGEQVYLREFPLTPSWLDTCLSGYLLAMYVTSKGHRVHSWVFYELGMSIIASCQYDASLFFSIFGITPAQIAYVFFMLSYHTSYPHHLGNAWNPPSAKALFGIQSREGGHTPDEVLSAAAPIRTRQDTGFVFDVGMGLGADTRYYLAQGFRVVAVEANPVAIADATSDAWLQPFLASGQLSVVHAAIVKSVESRLVPFVQYTDRPEQSRTVSSEDEAFAAATLSVTATTCAQLVLTYGQPTHLKIDVEEQTVDCIRSLHREGLSNANETFAAPKSLSLEVENTGLLPELVVLLQQMGYLLYKVCRQSVYSPAACETSSSEARILGCGSGPFGDAAVDYLYGLEWRNLSLLLEDAPDWERDWGGNRDWFDIHVK